ncbi:MAG: restriction endonuclease subunit S [Thermoguttaceae bacterium]|nr:restriction endonuclease subunit S [Thermoguttaceae bacterium]
MPNINELIKKHCPNGVEFKRLDEIGDFVRGSGLQKKDFVENGVGCIHYGQIYTYYGTFATQTKSFVSEEKARKFKKASCGNLVIAATSENIGDLCKAVAWLGKENICISGDAFIYRHSQVPKYIAYLFQTQAFAKHKKRYVTGTKVFRVSATDLGKFLIPVPPLPVQREIVRILDKFTKLEAELEAELEARRKQYEYYRNELLTFSECENRGGGQIRRLVDLLRQHCPDGVKYVELGKIGDFVRGSGLQKKDFAETGVGCIHYGQIYTCYGTYATRTLSFVPPELAQKLRRIKYGDLVIACTSENLKDLCKAVVWLGRDEIVTGGHACVFSHNQNPKYIAYFFQTSLFYEQKRKFAKGTKVIEIKASELAKIQIPLPSLAEQERIVAILDRFETLVNDLSVGLPAELAARRRQYEYYRDRLLTFQPLEQKP